VACKCADKVEAHLRSQGYADARLPTTQLLSEHGRRVEIVFGCTKDGERVGSGLIATCCPFCGVRYLPTEDIQPVLDLEVESEGAP
jgi:hypothetical protein